MCVCVFLIQPQCGCLICTYSGNTWGAPSEFLIKTKQDFVPNRLSDSLPLLSLCYRTAPEKAGDILFALKKVNNRKGWMADLLAGEQLVNQKQAAAYYGPQSSGSHDGFPAGLLGRANF